MLNDYSALNTMFRKTPDEQTSFVSPKGKEKQSEHPDQEKILEECEGR